MPSLLLLDLSGCKLQPGGNHTGEGARRRQARHAAAAKQGPRRACEPAPRPLACTTGQELGNGSGEAASMFCVSLPSAGVKAQRVVTTCSTHPRECWGVVMARAGRPQPQPQRAGSAMPAAPTATHSRRGAASSTCNATRAGRRARAAARRGGGACQRRRPRGGNLRPCARGARCTERSRSHTGSSHAPVLHPSLPQSSRVPRR